MLPILTQVIGDDCDYDFNVVDADGAPEDVTGWAFWFTVKASAADADAAALFQLTSDAGDIVVDTAAAGLGRIRVHAANTKGKPAGKYLFDFQSRQGGAGEPIVTLSRGTFTFVDEITQAS